MVMQVAVGPGESCRGDGMGGNIGSKVFKAPNKTQWDCTIEGTTEVKCKANNLKSSLIIAAASARHFFKGYHTMKWDDWNNIMGNKSVRKCDQNYKSMSNEIWVPEGCAK
ncbi:MAG TPA: hypothetical protein VNJ08_09945 [Bacteriovoracaceae bacterium]|nr:hypothetical protein [Bacteriovoracaceae bacterium]